MNSDIVINEMVAFIGNYKDLLIIKIVTNNCYLLDN